MSSKHRSPNSSNASNKLRLDSLNKILKITDVGKNKRRSIAKQVGTIALSELLRDAPSRLKNIPDFKVFLSNEENVQLFREFLKTQYCHENLDFYIACEKYRNLDPDKVGEEIMMKFMANQIFNDYLAENARQPINVDNSCRLNIASKMKNPRPDLLIEAQTEIFNLMRADCYPRFCKTWQLNKETARKILCEKATVPKRLMPSPPPPPLPPKPRRYQTRSSPVDDSKLHPYVGKVFHV